MPDESPIDLDEHARNIAEVTERAKRMALPTADGSNHQEAARSRARKTKPTGS